MSSLPAVEWRVKAELQGGLLHCAVSDDRGCRAPVGASRGDVHGFSRASRKRMLDLTARWDFPAGRVAAFVGLTYGEDFPCPRCAKKDLRAFVRRLERHCQRHGYGDWAGLAILWRLEAQKRGAPHFHLIIFGPFVPWQLMSRWWAQIAGHGDPDLTALIAEHGSSVKTLDSVTMARRYVAKYVAKVPSVEADEDRDGVPAGSPSRSCGRCRLDAIAYWDAPGRWWGVVGRDFLPMGIKVAVELVRGRWFYALKRVARRQWKGVNKQRSKGFTLYVGDGDAWGRLLASVIADELAGPVYSRSPGVGSRSALPMAPACEFCQVAFRVIYGYDPLFTF